MSLTEEQQAIRSRGVGASEVAAIMGLDPYRSAIDVWRSKCEPAPQEETKHTKRGRFLERALIDWYVAETHRDVTGCETLAHKQCPLVLATPDGIVLEGGNWDRVLEIKAPSYRTAHQWDDGAVPDRYVLQVTQQMLVTGLNRADLAAYIDEDLRIHTLEFDAELGEQIISSINDFWKHVESRTPPPVDGSESYARYLRERFTKTRGAMVTATAEAEDWAKRLRDAKKALETAELSEREARNHLELIIGDADGIEGSFGKISYRFNKPGRKTDWEAVARELGAPETVIAKHTNEKPGPRVFRATWAK